MLKYLIKDFYFPLFQNLSLFEAWNQENIAVNMEDLACLLATVRTLKDKLSAATDSLCCAALSDMQLWKFKNCITQLKNMYFDLWLNADSQMHLRTSQLLYDF